MNNKISLLLITQNESANLKKWSAWLPSLTSITEVVAVDGGSTDDTLKVLESLSTKNTAIKIIKGSATADFSIQRTLALKNCTNELIFWLDADETPSPKLIKFLNNGVFADNTDYSFPRHDIFLGHQLAHGETANQFFLRLFHRSNGKFSGAVHEVWQSTNPTVATNFPIIHTPNRDLRQFITKLNFYTDLRSQELFDQKVTTNLFQIIAYPLGKFLYDYFILLGFLDGTPGIILALCMSLHSFLVRAKLWTLSNP